MVTKFGEGLKSFAGLGAALPVLAVASQASSPAVEPSNVMTYRSVCAVVSDHVDGHARNIN
jgi:hypothetical protein